jgi:CheY-like chemotaxis protein
MPRILVIEDDPDMVEAIRLPLEASGCEVIAAATGVEGLQRARDERPDLVILDAMMETATAGFQVSLRLRDPDPASEYAECRHVPILMLSAIHSTTSLSFGPDENYLPVDEFVEKPIDPDVLVEKVQALLERPR